MAAISSLGIGTGIDLNALVTKLVAAESKPLDSLKAKQASYNSRISAFGALKSKLSELQTAAKNIMADVGQATPLGKFATFSATSSDATVATATAGTGAVAGTYAINVTKLAAADQFVSSPTTSATAPIGSVGDTLTFDFGAPADPARQKTITLDGDNNSLVGLRNSINAAGMGVTAAIVNGNAGAQLVLTGQGGSANAIAINSATGSLSGLFTQSQTAADAQFTVNGIAATSDSNSTNKVIDGITLNLNKTGASTLTVNGEYSTKLTDSLKAFVTAYNSANSLMNSQGAYDPATKTAGALQGNSVLRQAQFDTRNLIYGATAGGATPYQRLADIGISTNTDGSLKLDSAKLSAAIAADPTAVATLADKVGSAFNSRLEQIVSFGGAIQIATDGANAMVKELGKRQEAMQSRLDALEARYRAQFTAMDSLVSKLNATGTFLSSRLGVSSN